MCGGEGAEGGGQNSLQGPRFLQRIKMRGITIFGER